MNQQSIKAIAQLDLRFDDKPWPFARERATKVEAHFENLKRERPQIWNGRVLLMHAHEFTGDTLHGRYLETDFASFAAWRAWGFPEAGVRNCFGAAAIFSSDNALLLGEMAPHTANAGQIYFPCGTPDRDDLTADGCIDLAASAMRELEEETGLRAHEFEISPGFTVVFDRGEIVIVRNCHSGETAERLRERIRETLAAQTKAELTDILIVRGAADLIPAMPPFISKFVGYADAAGHFQQRT